MIYSLFVSTVENREPDLTEAYMLVDSGIPQGSTDRYVPVTSYTEEYRNIISYDTDWVGQNPVLPSQYGIDFAAKYEPKLIERIRRYLITIRANDETITNNQLYRPTMASMNNVGQYHDTGVLAPGNSLKWVDCKDLATKYVWQGTDINTNYVFELPDDGVQALIFKTDNRVLWNVWTGWDSYNGSNQFAIPERLAPTLLNYNDEIMLRFDRVTKELVLSLSAMTDEDTSIITEVTGNPTKAPTLTTKKLDEIDKFVVKFNGDTYELGVAGKGEETGLTDDDNYVESEELKIDCSDITGNQATPIKAQVIYKNGAKTPFVNMYYRGVSVVEPLIIGDNIHDIVYADNSFGGNFKVTKADWVFGISPEIAGIKDSNRFAMINKPITIDGTTVPTQNEIDTFVNTGIYLRNTSINGIHDSSQVSKSVFRKGYTRIVNVENQTGDPFFETIRITGGTTSVIPKGDNTEYFTNDDTVWNTYDIIEPHWYLEAVEKQWQPKPCSSLTDWDGDTVIYFDETNTQQGLNGEEIPLLLIETNIYLNSQLLERTAGYSGGAKRNGETAYAIYNKFTDEYECWMGFEGGGIIRKMGIILDNDYKMVTLTVTIDQSLCVLGWKTESSNDNGYVVYNYDLYFTKSVDNGVTWTEPTKVKNYNKPFIARVSQSLIDGKYSINGISPYSINGGTTWQ